MQNTSSLTQKLGSRVRGLYNRAVSVRDNLNKFWAIWLLGWVFEDLFWIKKTPLSHTHPADHAGPVWPVMRKVTVVKRVLYATDNLPPDDENLCLYVLITVHYLDGNIEVVIHGSWTNFDGALFNWLTNTKCFQNVCRILKVYVHTSLRKKDVI